MSVLSDKEKGLKKNIKTQNLSCKDQKGVAKHLLIIIHYKIVYNIKKPETLEFRVFLDKKLLPFTSIKINL